MATCAITTSSKEPETLVATWVLTSADPTGDAVSYPQHGDKSWQFTGTWGTGGTTAAAQGSHVNTDGLFGAVTNANGGAPITATGNSTVKVVFEPCVFDRPKLTTAGADASVTVTLLMRKGFR